VLLKHLDLYIPLKQWASLSYPEKAWKHVSKGFWPFKIVVTLLIGHGKRSKYT
jgi:hypothetical protein